MNLRKLTYTSLLIALATLTSCSLPTPPGAPAAAPAAATAAQSSNTIIADGSVVPARHIDLAFEVGGTVANVLVRESERVAANAPLAQLYTNDLELQVAQRQADLTQAQANYKNLVAGSSKAAIAAQQALVRSAQAQVERARSGNTTTADLASAQAQLRAAQARLDALKNPSPANLSAAQLALTQAQQDLASTRTNSSASKTNAELAMQQASDTLTKAQASYATAKENWEYVNSTGADPTNPTFRDAAGKKQTNTLNDVQKRQYYEAFVQAEASVRSAEKALQQDQVSYEQARQAEISQNQQAEAALANALQQLTALKNPSPNDLTQAQASVDQAKASLQKLQQGGTSADLAIAQAALDQAQANLEQLTAPARDTDRSAAQSRIDVAQLALQQAQRNLAKATLRAPFAGMIAERNLEIGQQIGAATTNANQLTPFVLADQSSWKIETTNLNERNVVRIQVGTPAKISFEAIPDLTLTGKVTAIRPRGADRFGDMTYTVTITPDSWDERLRWNMSASVAIAIVAR